MEKDIIKTQLIRDIENTKKKHRMLKEEIIQLLDLLIETEEKVNNKINELHKIEENFVELVELFIK